MREAEPSRPAPADDTFSAAFAARARAADDTGVDLDDLDDLDPAPAGEGEDLEDLGGPGSELDRLRARAGKLRRAAALGWDGLVGTLLDRGVDPSPPDAEGRTALMLAAAGGHQRVIAMLLAGGADPSRTDSRGLTAADHAWRAGHHPIARELARGKDGAGP